MRSTFICEICEYECEGRGPHCEECADAINDGAGEVPEPEPMELEEGYFH